MPSPALTAFQEKVAADPQLQEEFVAALNRFTKAVTDSGKENGHAFESQDVFRFIQGTFLAESGRAGAESVFFKLFMQAAGQSSVTSQLSTLNVGQNSELLDALKNPAAPQVSDSEPVSHRAAETSGKAAVVDQAADVATPAMPGIRGEKAATEGLAPESAGPGGDVTVSSARVADGLRPSQETSAASDAAEHGATGWDESTGDRDAEWNQAKKPWWKFW